MKNWYGICFLTAMIALLLGFTVGIGLGGKHMRAEDAVPDTVYETETIPEVRIAIDPEATPSEAEEAVAAAVRTERFFLVSETGYLLVFTEGKKDECLQTHIPITDFPEEEREKLRQGIWFDSMLDVFFYLESYTS